MDLYYEDGGNPSEQILQRFLRICEDTKVGQACGRHVCGVGFSCRRHAAVYVHHETVGVGRVHAGGGDEEIPAFSRTPRYTIGHASQAGQSLRNY